MTPAEVNKKQMELEEQFPFLRSNPLLSSALTNLLGVLEDGPRIGEGSDIPEGSVNIKMSDTLARMFARDIRDGLDFHTTSMGRFADTVAYMAFSSSVHELDKLIGTAQEADKGGESATVQDGIKAWKLARGHIVKLADERQERRLKAVGPEDPTRKESK